VRKRGKQQHESVHNWYITRYLQLVSYLSALPANAYLTDVSSHMQTSIAHQWLP